MVVGQTVSRSGWNKVHIRIAMHCQAEFAAGEDGASELRVDLVSLRYEIGEMLRALNADLSRASRSRDVV